MRAVPTFATTAQQCATFCGGFDAHYSFYKGDLATLPQFHRACTCLHKSNWTLLDSTATSGYVHGRGIGAASAALMASSVVPSAPVFAPLNGFVSVRQGALLPTPVELATTSRFSVTASFEMLFPVRPGNLLRVTPTRLNDCRPCLAVDTQGLLYANLYYSSEGWWTFLVLPTLVLQPNTLYTARITLANRRLLLEVEEGATLSSHPQFEAATSLALQGEFPKHESVVVYAGSDNAAHGGSTADAMVDADSLAITETLGSHRSFAFSFDSDLSRNDERFHVGLTAPALSHAADVAAYAATSPSRARLVASGYRGQAARFDRHSVLVMQTSPQQFLVDGADRTGSTLCLWAFEELPIDTLFTTLGGFGDAFALRFYAFYSDVSATILGANVRATTPSLAHPSGWTHYCTSTAIGGQSVLYVNGTRVVSAPFDGAALTPTVPFAVGGSVQPEVIALGTDRGFGGLIDSVVGWARQLSDVEVLQVFSS